MSKSYYTTFVGKDNQYYFNLKAGNHEIILQSEGYKNKQGAFNGVKSVQVHCPDEENFRKKVAKDGSPFFVLKAKNNETIGRSEMYSSKQMMLKGISIVRTNGITKTIKGFDKTIYEVFLNDKSYVVDSLDVKGGDILSLGGFSSNWYCLFLIKDGKRVEVKANEIIRITPCSHFVTVRND